MHYCLSFSVSLNGFNLNAHQMENLLHVDGAAIKWNFMQCLRRKGQMMKGADDKMESDQGTFFLNT